MLLAVAGGGIGVALTVVTPIRGMALAPAPLGRRLIGPVAGTCRCLELPKDRGAGQQNAITREVSGSVLVSKGGSVSVSVRGRDHYLSH